MEPPNLLSKEDDQSPPSSPPTCPFSVSDPNTLSSFGITRNAFKEAHPSINALGTGVLVFNPTRTHLLLVQRAATDSSPNKWEFPGGGVDREDPSILHGCARELLEEAGLTATRVGPVVPLPLELADPRCNVLQTNAPEGAQMFFSSRGLRCAKFTFLVDVKEGDEVVLDSKEHQRFVWATEGECREGRKGDLELVYPSPQMKAIILEGWRLVKAAPPS